MSFEFSTKSPDKIRFWRRFLASTNPLFQKNQKKLFAAEKTDESLRFLYEYKVKLCIAEVAPMRELEPAAEVMDASARSSDPLEHRVETAEPAAEVMDASARSSDPLEHRPEEGVELLSLRQMPLRGRATHSDIKRLRQVGILRRRLSRRQET